MSLGRRELTGAVHDIVDLSRTECRDLIDQAIEEMTAVLARGEKIGISSFGAFIVPHVRQPSVAIRTPACRQTYQRIGRFGSGGLAS
jgi:nucleoid DNA-binding protein